MLDTSNEVVTRALEFAYTAHANQLHRYTNKPYIIHPIAVAALVASVTNDQNMIAAALLHDTVEDTEATTEVIQTLFCTNITILVAELTDVSILTDGDRSVRKSLDLAHTAMASPAAKTIKLADLIDNSESILAHAPKLAIIYMKEKRALLEVLKEGNHILYARAKKIVSDYFEGTN